MMHIQRKLIRLVLLVGIFTAGMLIPGCSDSTSPETGKGQFKLTMIDAPADYDQVNIVVTSVEVNRANYDLNNSWFVINNNAATYDLLKLRNGASVVIGNRSLEAGLYNQIRLIIGTGSNVVVDGVAYPLEIPSGEQTGIKLNHAFEIQSGLLYELILDFDAERSIILTGNGQYKLKPVIRVIPVVISGSITGRIEPISAAGFVYAINGADTAATTAEPATGLFKYMALPEQTYRVEVFSANASYKDTIITNVAVQAKQNTDLGIIILSAR